MAGIAAAQQAAPHGQGAPSVDQEAFVVERLATRVACEADGSGTRETVAVIRVQAQAGVQGLAVLTFAYVSSTDSIEIAYVRVRKPDGTVVATPAYNIQDMPADITRAAPMYSDNHEKHITVKGLAVGDVPEYSVLYRTAKPEVPGQFWFEYSFLKDAVVEGEDLELSAPRSLYLNVSSPDYKPVVEEQGDRRIYRWHNANPKRREASPGSAKPGEAPAPSVEVSTSRSWEEVGRWYRDLEAPRTTVTAAIRAKAAEITKGITTDGEKIRALYNFVATRFHYVSLSFGVGRYEPHPAGDVLENGYGDCKDKHTLLAALLKAAGYDAWPVLINSARKVTAGVPSPRQFDHVITIVPLGDALLWLDTTPEVAPFAYLLPSLRDKQALVIPTNQSPSLMATPAALPFAVSETFVADGKLGQDGIYTAHIERTLRGDGEVLFRTAFRATAPAQWKDLVQRVSYALGFSGEVSSVTASAPDDTEKPFQYSYDYTRKDFGDWPNRKFFPPLQAFGFPDAGETKPEKGISLGSAGEANFRSKTRLPEGYTLVPPDKIDMINGYAEYHARYSFEKGVVSAERRIVTKGLDVPPSQWESYRKFVKAVNDDQYGMIQMSGHDASGKPLEPGMESEDADALNDSGKNALDAKNYPLAIDLLNKAVKIAPRHKWAWNNLGLAYMNMQRYDEAVAAYRKQVEIQPKDLYAYNNLGQVLELQGKYAEARDAFEKQIAVSPQDRWAHSNLGVLLSVQKDYAGAVRELEAAAAIAQLDPMSEISLGEAYLNTGQAEKALPHLERGVDLAPAPMLLNRVADDLAEKGKYLDKAQKFAETAIASMSPMLRDLQLKDVQPMHLYIVSLLGATWDTLGWAYFEQGKTEPAERYIKASWDLTQHGGVGDHLGQLHEKQGDKQLAKQYYARALAARYAPRETRARLTALAGGEAQADLMIAKARDDNSAGRTVAVVLSKPAPHTAAEFFVSFSPGPKVAEVRFISGDHPLEAAQKDLAAARFDVKFPDEQPVRIVRRGILNCPSADTTCTFVLLLPD